MHHRFEVSVAQDPNVSILRHSQELELSYGRLWRILHLDLHLHLQLKPDDYSQCRRYVEWVLKQQTVDGNSSNKIFFGDKAYLTLGGYVYKKIVVFRILRILK